MIKWCFKPLLKYIFNILVVYCPLGILVNTLVEAIVIVFVLTFKVY